jgi:hypothetical protein
MGLKGYMLWDIGQLDSNVQSPTVGAARVPRAAVVVLRLVPIRTGAHFRKRHHRFNFPNLRRYPQRPLPDVPVV